jgi:hypothetical protein
MSGVAALKAASDAEKKGLQQQHQATMTVAGPEGRSCSSETAASTSSFDVAQALRC